MEMIKIASIILRRNIMGKILEIYSRGVSQLSKRIHSIKALKIRM